MSTIAFSIGLALFKVREHPAVILRYTRGLTHVLTWFKNLFVRNALGVLRKLSMYDNDCIVQQLRLQSIASIAFYLYFMSFFTYIPVLFKA